jgi:hypothetical protein
MVCVGTEYRPIVLMLTEADVAHDSVLEIIEHILQDPSSALFFSHEDKEKIVQVFNNN